MTLVAESVVDARATPSKAPVARSRPRWERPALLLLLAATAVLYLWDLGASGYANGFYSAAVEAGSKSWKAMFFGSFDSSSFITVDKPPASLWVMDLSARAFGVNAWSILVPQALEGVAAVGLLYATVRRRFSAAAALIAAAAFALTPVAVLMFRFNNPDALLVLLLVVAAYAVVRALDDGRTRWLVLAGSLVGFGFLTKMMQAFLVLPAFALVFLYAGPATLRRRVRQLAVGGAAMVMSAGWWVAIVTAIPAADRPYIGGSQHNSILELIFGYNGFGRLTGQETGSVGGSSNATGRWGATGLTRMFNSEFGGQISWLLPAALMLLVAMLWLGRRAARTNAQRAQVLLWGGWLVVTGVTFSLAAGIIHPYYSVALAPPIAALVGIGAVGLWRQRARVEARVALAAATAVTAWWSAHLLARTPTWHPALRTFVLVAGLAAAAAIVLAPQLSRRAALVAAGTALAVTLTGPAAYAVSTATTPHSGAIPSAGPVAGGFGGPGPRPGGAFAPPAGARAGGGGLGGLLDSATPSAELTSLLARDASSYTWVAATVGANSGAGVQLATALPVLAIGGFNGTDPTPTLAQFQALVAAGKVHYFLASGAGFGAGPGGPGGPGGGSSTSQAITAWVQSHFQATTVGGVTVYDLTTAS